MADSKSNPEPRGFSEHTRRSSGENAHQQGWGLNEDERRRLPRDQQDYQGGTDYDFGARDFGDGPIDTAKLAAIAANPQSKTRRRKAS